MKNNTETNLFELVVKYILKRKYLISAITMSMMIISFGYTFIAPHSYTSETTILPPMEKSGGGGLSALVSSMGSGVPFGGLLGGGSSSTDYYIDIVNSRKLASDVCNTLELYSRPIFQESDTIDVIDFVQNSIEAEFELSGILLLSSRVYTGFFPDSSTREKYRILSGAIAKEYIHQLDRFLISREVNKAQETRKYIENELNGYKNKADSLALLMEQFQSDNKLLSIDEQTAATITQASTISAELAIAQTELELARITFKESSQEVESLKSKITALERQYSGSQSGGISSADKFSLPLSKIPNLARRYAILYRDREVLEKVILYLETQKHQEAIQETKEVTQIDVLDEAVPPIKRTSPSRIIVTAVSGLITSILTVFVLVLLAYKKGKKAGLEV